MLTFDSQRNYRMVKSQESRVSNCRECWANKEYKELVFMEYRKKRNTFLEYIMISLKQVVSQSQASLSPACERYNNRSLNFTLPMLVHFILVLMYFLNFLLVNKSNNRDAFCVGCWCIKNTITSRLITCSEQSVMFIAHNLSTFFTLVFFLHRIIIL